MTNINLLQILGEIMGKSFATQITLIPIPIIYKTKFE